MDLVNDRVYVLPIHAGSSTDVSEDWEKDFDLDMTEEEVQMALSKVEASGDVGYINSTLNAHSHTHTFYIRLLCLMFCTKIAFYMFSSWMRTGRTGTEECDSVIKTSSRQTNHAYCVLTLCPRYHNVPFVHRRMSAGFGPHFCLANSNGQPRQ